jgi:hypothetical protein
MNIVLSIVMLAAFALVAGAFVMWRRGAPPKQPLLMILLAIIAIANVAVWTVPGESGDAPINQIED